MSPGTDESVRGIVLAGDHPWNGCALDSVMPRVLAPVLYRPLVCYSLDWLRESGIIHATLCANGESRHVRTCLGTGSEIGMALEYYEDWTPRGPAGCVRDAAMQSDGEVFVVVEGAIIPRIDLRELVRAHADADAAVTVVVSSDHHNGNGLGRHLSPTGIYVFQREALQHVSKTGYQDIKEVLILRLYDANRRVVTYVTEKECPRVSDAASYLSVNGWMLAQITSDPESLPEYRKVGESRVHRNARLADSAKLVGPVLVGPFAEVSEGTTIVGPTIIGVGSCIEARAVVCRSVILDRCLVGQRSVVDQCAIMHEATVEPDKRLYHVIHHVNHVEHRRNGGSLLQRLLPKRQGTKGKRSPIPSGVGLIGSKKSRVVPARRGREVAVEPRPI